MVTELKYTILANIRLQNEVTRFLNSLKLYKLFSSLCQKFGFCDMCLFHFHAFSYSFCNKSGGGGNS
jgi:hypothetical protein